jgi:hypothetical protein
VTVGVSKSAWVSSDGDTPPPQVSMVVADGELCGIHDAAPAAATNAFPTRSMKRSGRKFF